MQRRIHSVSVFALVSLTFGAWTLAPAVRPAGAQLGKTERGTGPTADQVLQQTERLLRPARPEELVALGQELLARGEETSARRVFTSIATAETDYERLVRQLFQLGQLTVVPDLLKSWARKYPRSQRPGFYQAVYYHAAGEFELAHRELRALTGRTPADLHPLVELQVALVEQSLRGTPAGADANPWNVRFTDESGGYTAGMIAAAQAKRLPARAGQALFELLLLLPRQGNLWYLAGEVANAQGNPQAALECFRRAEILQYSPKILRDRRRILEEYERQVRRDSEAALAKIPAVSGPAAAPAAEPPAGWSNLAANPKMLVILSVGGAFILFIFVLQVREWRRSRRR